MRRKIAGMLLRKVLVLALAHVAPTLDSYTTNRLANAGCPSMGMSRSLHCAGFSERNPFFKPFAGRPTMYLATNTDVALAEWLRAKHRKVGRVVFWATQASHGACAAWNVKLYNRLVASAEKPPPLFPGPARK